MSFFFVNSCGWLLRMCGIQTVSMSLASKILFIARVGKYEEFLIVIIDAEDEN